MQHILTEYQYMRGNGMSPRAAYHSLRPMIAQLSPADRIDLKNLLQRVELEMNAENPRQPQQQSMMTESPERQADSSVSHPAIRRLTPEMLQESLPANNYPDADKRPCPHCGKPNYVNVPLCYSCGQLIDSVMKMFSTRTFEDSVSPEDGYFSDQTSLMLQVRGTSYVVQLRPQDMGREIVIGRTTEFAKIVPDVDLAEASAEELGVSRLHISINYVPRDHAIQVIDLESANGSYLNGQKLHPKEVRILRHGDELRLSKLYIDVIFA